MKALDGKRHYIHTLADGNFSVVDSENSDLEGEDSDIYELKLLPMYNPITKS